MESYKTKKRLYNTDTWKRNSINKSRPRKIIINSFMYMSDCWVQITSQALRPLSIMLAQMQVENFTRYPTVVNSSICFPSQKISNYILQAQILTHSLSMGDVSYKQKIIIYKPRFFFYSVLRTSVLIFPSPLENFKATMKEVAWLDHEILLTWKDEQCFFIKKEMLRLLSIECKKGIIKKFRIKYRNQTINITNS